MENIFFDTGELAYFGKNSIMGKTVRIRRPELVRMGKNSIIDDFSYISVSLTIGDYTHIASGCYMVGGPTASVEIGSFANIAPGCSIIAGQNDYRGGGLVGPAIPKGYGGHSDIKPVKIGNHALIGCNSVILPGVELPEGVSVGAFSLLKPGFNFKPWTLYAGIPAKEIGERDGSLIKRQEQELREAEKVGKL